MLMNAKTADSLVLFADACISVTALVLFWTASSERFCEKLWEYGGVNEWNSNPNYRVYFYANYQEPPEIPLIWSERLTTVTLAVSLLSVVILVARVLMRHYGQMSRAFSMMYDASLLFFWFYSLRSQASGDFSDPKHPSNHPWYLTRQCPKEIATACHVAQASFVMSVFAVILYGTRFLATALGAVRVFRESRNASYQLVSEYPDHMEEEYDISLDEQMERERERYLYKEALSPVLDFFPEHAR